jgi:putative methionine-R-sulfoxide reductase with GAF domain
MTVRMPHREPTGVVLDRQPSVYSPAVAAWAESVVEDLSRDYWFGYSGVMLFDPEVGGLRLVGQRYTLVGSDGGSVVGETIVPLESVTGSVYLTGTPALLSDVRSHPQYRRVGGLLPGSEHAVPILVAGRAIGAINVESPRIGGLDIGDLERLQAVARRAAETLPDELVAAD